MSITESSLLTAKQVAERLNLPLQAVWRLSRRGELATVRIGARGVRFDPRDVQLFIDAHTSHRPRGQR